MSVFVTNVNDYIAPSQACVNPLFAGQSNASSSNGFAKISLISDLSQSDFEKKPDLIKSKDSLDSSTAKKIATVSLNDCLACRL